MWNILEKIHDKNIGDFFLIFMNFRFSEVIAAGISKEIRGRISKKSHGLFSIGKLQYISGKISSDLSEKNFEKLLNEFME